VDDSDLCQPFACPDRLGAVVSKQYLLGTEAPFIVVTDGPDRTLFTALDNLIAEHRVPVMMAISIGNGSGDTQGKVRSSDEPCPPNFPFARDSFTMVKVRTLFAVFSAILVHTLFEGTPTHAEAGTRIRCDSCHGAPGCNR
jgi:hypothetical protein